MSLGRLDAEGVPFNRQLRNIHGVGLVAEAAGVALFEGVVLQRNHQILTLEIDVLQLPRGVAVLTHIGFGVVGSAIEGEGKVVLCLAHLHHCGVCQGEGGVALVRRVVIYHHVIHHAGLLVLVADTEDVTVDAVVERACGNLDFVLCLADIVAEGVYFVVRLGDEVIADEEGAYRYDDGGGEEGKEDAGKGDAGGLDGHELVVFAHLPHSHHGCQQGGKGKTQRHGGATAPEHELQDNLESKSLADQFVDVYPEELHHKHEYHHEQNRDERSYEGLEYELV